MQYSKTTILKGVTLIEVVIGILIGSILFIALTKLFSSGIRISQKGSSHLTNVQAASILMTQIEKDLSTALGNFSGDTGSTLSFDMAENYGNLGELEKRNVKYEPVQDNLGYKRTQSAPAPAAGESHVFCSGLVVAVKWAKIQVPQSGKIGFFLEIATSKPPGGTEKNTLKRFIYCYNLPQNREKDTNSWKW